ncbi:MAG: TdeIII family type II restriction endonuclease [Ignavibacteriae bacterium]|nr:TdeIII family type II restriction endonuclease [Ignavibacteriota bacterium]
MKTQINEEVRLRVKGYLEGFVDGQIKSFNLGDLQPEDIRPPRELDKRGKLKPFHEVILPHGVLLINEFERSFSTALGSSFEEVAFQIAKSKYPIAERAKRNEGEIPEDALEKIDSLKGRLSINKTRFSDALNEVKLSNGNMIKIKKVISDLFFETTSNEEFHFEMKTAKPNSGQCETYNEKALKIHLLRESTKRKIYTFFTFAYNPYGQKREEYKHPYPHAYCDFEQSILIGQEFWDFIGGEGTYYEVLDIYREVGKEKGPEIIEKLIYRR